MSRRIDWRNYNQKLVNRGHFTLLIEQDLLKNWKEKGLLGRPAYSELLILTILTLRCAFNLTFRQTEGFVSSILKTASIPLACPDYTVLCKRMSTLKNKLPKLSGRRPEVILVDSSGIKIAGSGEWFRHKHRPGDKRKWLKIHIAVDAQSQEIIGLTVTDEKAGDPSQLEALLKQSPRSVDTVIGDGAYDTKKCRQAIARRGARALIPPRKGARLCRNEYEGSRERDDAIKICMGLGGDDGKKTWKSLVRYGRRSLVETSFSRFKGRFGGKLRSQTFDRQCVEINIKARILNREMNLAA